jgi:integrating conjugative element protein (TIGR03755 family)
MEKIILILLLPTAIFADNNYSNLIPSTDDSQLYYKIGGGDIVPTAPSMGKSISFNINDLGAVGFNCGTFDPKASIANSLNGLKNTAMSMYNDVVTSASGAIIEMPAYLFAKANPNLYELMQNGLFSGQWDLTTGLKSCQQMQSDIDTGKNPYAGMFDHSQLDKWKFLQHQSSASSAVKGSNLTYTQATNSDVVSASRAVDQSNGSTGVLWMHGSTVDGAKHAGGSNQDPILMTNDLVISGVNALLSRQDYFDKSDIPQDDGLYNFFKTPSEAATWATAILGENKIYTTIKQSSATTPGKGLLPSVQTEYQTIYQNLVDMISGDKPISVANLKSVSTARLMINADTIRQFQNDLAATRTMETSALAQGVASIKVIDKAQELIIILQAARQVPEISINSTAQDIISQYLATLNQQINLIVNNNETSKKLIVSTIDAIGQNKNRYLAKGNTVTAGANSNKPLVDGVIKA